MKYTNKQAECIKYIQEGKNVFVTGMSGTGKSAIIKIIPKLLKRKKVIVTSTTGTSSILIKGVTLHSYLGLGLGRKNVDDLAFKILSKSWLKKRWLQIETLVIDEISMLSPELFDKIEELARRVRKSSLIFGGIQIILSGDFLQLPTIGCSSQFCFESLNWDKAIDKSIYLTEIIRQRDLKFQTCLNKIRLGIVDTYVKSMLDSRINAVLDTKIIPTKLYSTNFHVNRENEIALDKLTKDGKLFYSYDMNITYTVKSNAAKNFIFNKIQKNSSLSEELILCKNAQVMLVKNIDIENGLANGSQGVVVGFTEDPIRPIVKFKNGQTHIIDKELWEIEELGKKIATIRQIPLKLSYALSIHRSQGVTLDFAQIDLRNIFEYGMAYVALSRLKSLDGLTITGIDYDSIRANPKAVSFYEKLSRSASGSKFR